MYRRSWGLLEDFYFLLLYIRTSCCYMHYTSSFTPDVLNISVFFGLIFRYRRALSNNCTEGKLLRFSPRQQKCPSQAPRGLQLFTTEGTMVATMEKNVTFLVFLEEVMISLIQSSCSVYCYICWLCTFYNSLKDFTEHFVMLKKKKSTILQKLFNKLVMLIVVVFVSLHKTARSR